MKKDGEEGKERQPEQQGKEKKQDVGNGLLIYNGPSAIRALSSFQIRHRDNELPIQKLMQSQKHSPRYNHSMHNYLSFNWFKIY